MKLWKFQLLSILVSAKVPVDYFTPDSYNSMMSQHSAILLANSQVAGVVDQAIEF